MVQMSFAAAALLGVDSSYWCFLVPRLGPVAYTWAISSRRRNRLLHALHGNGPVSGGGGQAWKTVGGGEQDARRLQELQTVGRLRAQGWMVAPQIGDDYQLRVYDTRLDLNWLAALMPDLGIGVSAECTHIVGGDFMQSPKVEDSVAMQSGRLQRWSPAGSGLCHLFVVPRPHQATWLQRAHLQMGVEDPGTWVSVSLVVPRDMCPQALEGGTLRRLVPSLGPLLDDAAIEVKVAAVGERPALVRVPASEKQLPPARWEPAFLPRSRVLLVVSLRRHAAVAPPLSARWIRGELPALPPSPLELLRVEFPLAPATKQQAAERALRSAVRKTIQTNGLAEPPTLQLRQVQVAHGAVYGILAVPRTQARGWLRASGCGGLCVRPFWAADTGEAFKRTHFSLLWVRGRSADGPRLWDVLREHSGFFGLLYEGKDLAVRVSSEADVPALQAQLRFAVQDDKAQFKQATMGQRWWRLGPLADAEVWNIKELVRRVGLEPLRGEIRFGKAGPFRTFAFFAAVGEPSRRTLDDGSWMATEAQLTSAGPPPRKPLAGGALPSQSVWGGARALVVSPPRRSPSVEVAAPAEFGPRRGAQRQRESEVVQPKAAVDRSPVPPQDGRDLRASSMMPGGGRARGGDRRQPTGGQAQAGMDDKLDRLIAQVEELSRANAAMAQELRALREENADLRRQLGAARGVHVHQPYATTVQPMEQVVSGPMVPVLVDQDVLMAASDAVPAVSLGAPSPNV